MNELSRRDFLKLTSAVSASALLNTLPIPSFPEPPEANPIDQPETAEKSPLTAETFKENLYEQLGSVGITIGDEPYVSENVFEQYEDLPFRVFLKGVEHIADAAYRAGSFQPGLIQHIRQFNIDYKPDIGFPLFFEMTDDKSNPDNIDTFNITFGETDEHTLTNLAARMPSYMMYNWNWWEMGDRSAARIFFEAAADATQHYTLTHSEEGFSQFAFDRDDEAIEALERRIKTGYNRWIAPGVDKQKISTLVSDIASSAGGYSIARHYATAISSLSISSPDAPQAADILPSIIDFAALPYPFSIPNDCLTPVFSIAVNTANAMGHIHSPMEEMTPGEIFSVATIDGKNFKHNADSFEGPRVETIATLKTTSEIPFIIPLFGPKIEINNARFFPGHNEAGIPINQVQLYPMERSRALPSGDPCNYVVFGGFEDTTPEDGSLFEFTIHGAFDLQDNSIIEFSKEHKLHVNTHPYNPEPTPSNTYPIYHCSEVPSPFFPTKASKTKHGHLTT